MGTCIKGSYRDKGINTSTKCGEFDGRSSSKSYLFGVSLSLLSPLSLSLSSFCARSLAQHLPLPFLSLPFSWFAFTPIPSCPPLSTAAVGSSRYSIPVARWRFGSTIPPRQTRLGSILPNESRALLHPSLRRWKLERAMCCTAPTYRGISSLRFVNLFCPCS